MPTREIPPVGPERDRAIAEALGWYPDWSFGAWWQLFDENRQRQGERGHTYKDDAWRDCPAWSTDDAVAPDLRRRMEARGYTWELYTSKSGYHCEFWRIEDIAPNVPLNKAGRYPHGVASGPTDAAATSAAACLALMAEKEVRDAQVD